ncbi:MAG: response regulator [Rariglobus sp.]|nr:response regulator [Rariglobus sp.]
MARRRSIILRVSKTWYPPPALPVLFLLDINMPRCSGLEVLERLRDMPLRRTMPIVVFSSSNHPRDVEQAYRLGANAYLVKPTSTIERNEMIRTVQAFWLQLNQIPAAT